MTIGIYALYWQQDGSVYIGQSANIERRFKQHLTLLKSGVHENFKLQAKYDALGEPLEYVLETCRVKELDAKEVLWIDEFDSIRSGLNIIAGGGHSYGTEHTTSKYSKIQLYKALILLAKTDNSLDSITSRTGVSKSTLSHIINKRVHTWLAEVRPELYLLAVRDRVDISRKNTAKTRTGIGIKGRKYIVTSPEGLVHEVVCISKFCKEVAKFDNPKAAQSGFSRVIKGLREDYFGWKIEKILT